MSMEQTKQPKTPIFIGCKDPEVIRSIDSYVFEKESWNYELAVISPSIQEKLDEQYLLQTAKSNINADLIARQQNEAERNQARESALSLRSVIHSVFDSGYAFDRSDVKFAISRKRGKISTNETANLVNFLSLHNFIQPVDVEQKPHKRRFVFTFTNEELINATSNLQLGIVAQIEMLQQQYDMLEQNKKLYAEGNELKEGEAIEGEMIGVECKADGTMNTTVIEEPKKKRGRPKKVYPADLDEHDSDCRCGQHSKEKTETEKYLDEESNKE